MTRAPETVSTTSPESTPMLRIAVPNKGSLAETAAQMLFEAGYTGPNLEWYG